MEIDRVKLAAEMARKRLTVNALAEEANLSRITVSAIKNGKTCSPESATRIAKALNCPVGALLKDVPN